jgi:hypothetical protein
MESDLNELRLVLNVPEKIALSDGRKVTVRKLKAREIAEEVGVLTETFARVMQERAGKVLTWSEFIPLVVQVASDPVYELVARLTSLEDSTEQLRQLTLEEVKELDADDLLLVISQIVKLNESVYVNFTKLAGVVGDARGKASARQSTSSSEPATG